MNTAMLRLKPYLLALVIFFAVVVTGCGQTGDLYLPEDNPEQKFKNQS